jgi:hypothetical protein
MFEENQRRKVCGSSVATYTQSFPFQLFKSRCTGTAEDGGIIKAFNSSNQHEVEARQVGLHDLANAHEWRISRGQGLDRQLSAAKENRFYVQSILREQSFVFSNPNVALPEAQGRITHPDALKFLGNGKSGRGQKDQ